MSNIEEKLFLKAHFSRLFLSSCAASSEKSLNMTNICSTKSVYYLSIKRTYFVVCIDIWVTWLHDHKIWKKLGWLARLPELSTVCEFSGGGKGCKGKRDLPRKCFNDLMKFSHMKDNLPGQEWGLCGWMVKQQCKNLQHFCKKTWVRFSSKTNILTIDSISSVCQGFGYLK